MFGFDNKFSISQEEFLKKAAEGAHIIDVRSPEEFQGGHIKDAENIPVNLLTDQLSQFKDYADKEEPVLLYCLSGSRSAMAQKFLSKNGLADQVFDLKGGISRWQGPLK